MWQYKYYAAVMFFLLSLTSIFLPIKVHAFSCTNNGTQTVSVDLTLPDSNAMVLVSDMSTYTICTGNVGPWSQNDALRVQSFTTSTALENQGYTGYFQTPYSTFPDSTTYSVCAWPQVSDLNCDPVSISEAGYSEPLALKIYVKRTGVTTSDNLVLKAGTEVARISLDQRSNGSWGWRRTWIFVLEKDVPIPAHTCNVDASTPSTVTLNTISANSLAHQGSTSAAADFNIKLKCQGNVGVNILLDGQEDQNATAEGVLANITNSTPASGVGIQILYDSIPVKLRETFSAGVSTDGNYDIPMQARYYRTTTSSIGSGNIKSVMTYNLTYK
ncbi:fimbrial protein [Citrobacter sp. Awk 4]|nr:fimbrial protein [Citrobacter sp. Awk 4]